ncbi:metal-dependent hydrolase [Enhygromyxa salina]|uniref:Metal-dependent hydrolase n=1 Tax=Enhygromyxa salina TaxID=215803 RepID=A0A2S9Y4R7_9BACT|nr:MBL fold metallo-hydrolase [Enhygromyxa salina]PRQ00001.1 metal-dependent hydrolase [Enhygromyxa salina]
MSAPAPKRLARRRRRRRIALVSLALTLGFGLVVLVQAWVPIGKAAQGARLERMKASPQWHGGEFENPQPLWNDAWGMVTEMFSASDYGRPAAAIPVVSGDAARFDQPPSTGLRVTWLGHSTLLVEIDGHRVLTDPIWGPRTAPLTWLGPERWYPPPIPLAELPTIDAVVISHDHYDHLDQPTIDRIKGWDTTFIAPLGVGAHLAYWGVPESQIVELDWWQQTRVGSLDIVCAPARHASGRQLFDQNATLWAGYAFVGPDHRVFFSGDTGLFPGMTEIGDKLGPFDLTMIEAGAYGQAWPDWHIGPEQAVRAHQMLRGQVMLPVHWGLFNLAYHGWTEPIERTLVAAEAAGVRVAAPRPGQSFEPEALGPGPVERWWPEVPWRSADEYPIVSTAVD